MKVYSTKPICVIGDVYDIGTGHYERKSVFINDGKIVKIIGPDTDTDLLQSHHVINLEPGEVMLPTFVNLHAHIGYNVLPLWDSGNIWGSRHQWRNSSQYQRDIKQFVNFIRDEWTKNSKLFSEFISEFLPAAARTKLAGLVSSAPYLELFELYALTEIEKIHAILSEIMAVCGGTGVLLQTLDLDDEDPAMKHFLIRNTGNPEDIGIPQTQGIFDVVDFYRPEPRPTGQPNEDTSKWKPGQENSLTDYLNSLGQNDSKYFSTIAHIGEGKTGNLGEKVKDRYSRNECKALIDQLRAISPEHVRASNLVLVHANGIDYDDPDTLRFLADNNISIVWSPVSNMLLYNDTLPIQKILDAGINVALGTDWTPSGSKHMLDEMKFALQFSEKYKLNISENSILQMGSINAARALGQSSFGRIQEGSFADLFVFKVDQSQSVARCILLGKDHQVKFVMINGRVVYGDDIVFENLQVGRTAFPETEGEHASKKAISVNESLKFDLVAAISKMDKLIKVYSTDILKKPTSRPRFLSSDDKQYQERIGKLVAGLIVK